MKNNYYILGCGRSGTSLFASMFTDPVFYSGMKFPKLNDANPLGFYEDEYVNTINEMILSKMYPFRSNHMYLKVFQFNRFPKMGRWLVPKVNKNKLVVNDEIIRGIKSILNGGGLCLKDPRYSYTIEEWLKIDCSDPVIICMVRNPNSVAKSIEKEVNKARYLRSLRPFGIRKARKVWCSIYESVLSLPDEIKSKIVWVSYEKLMDSSEYIKNISSKIGVELNSDMIKPELYRNHGADCIPDSCMTLWSELTESTRK